MNEYVLKSVLNRSKEEMIRELKTLDFVKGTTIIGENVSKRKLTNTNDLDTVIILNNTPTKTQYLALKKIFENLRNHETKETDLIYKIISGPFKPLTEKETEIFYHVLLFTPESYRQFSNNLVKNSWQYESPEFGCSLSQIQVVDGVTREELLHGKSGLEHTLRLLQTNKILCNSWELNEEGSLYIPKKYLKDNESNQEKTDFYIYSILRSASNFMRYVTGNQRLGIDESMSEQFEDYTDDSFLSRTLNSAIADKKSLRKNDLKTSDSFTRTYQDMASEFNYALMNRVAGEI